jgi:hypothetical protein
MAPAGVTVEIADVAPAAAPAPEAALASVPDAEANVEAARYALFRRILPVLRHGLAGELQSVQFAVSLARRSCDRVPHTGEIAEAIARIGEQASAAIGRGQAITDWLRPDPRATISVGEGVHACLDIVGTEWSLRGIEVTTSLAAAAEIVESALFRVVLAAMLVALGDSLPGAADVTLKARKRGRHVMISLRGQAAPRDGEGARVSLYRDLRWSDVAALAGAHGVAWAQRGDHVLARIPLAGTAG